MTNGETIWQNEKGGPRPLLVVWVDKEGMEVLSASGWRFRVGWLEEWYGTEAAALAAIGRERDLFKTHTTTAPRRRDVRA